jgi:hypothetical protein
MLAVQLCLPSVSLSACKKGENKRVRVVLKKREGNRDIQELVFVCVCVHACACVCLSAYIDQFAR